MKMTTSKMGTIKYIFEKVVAFVMVFLLTPGYYIFHMTIIRPYLLKQLNMGTAMHIFHVCLSFFIFFNVCGNMFLAILTDTKVPKKPVKRQESGRYCEYCKVDQPLKSFHCNKCNVCILRRDHHCFFLSRCIGLRNQRYYMMYLIYISIGLIYSTYFDFFFVSSMYETYDFIIAVMKVFNPVVTFLSTYPVGIRDLYVLFFDFNGIFIFWSVSLLCFHFLNIMRGITTYESKQKVKADTSNWKENMRNTFGERWYLAIIWPFAESPLPKSFNLSVTYTRNTTENKTV